MTKKRPALIPPKEKKKPEQPAPQTAAQRPGQLDLKTASVLMLKAAKSDEYDMIEMCKQKTQVCIQNINAINAELASRRQPGGQVMPPPKE